MRHISRIGAILAMALASQLAFGQATMYKSTLPDGRVIYGEKPAPDAVKVESMKPDTSNRGIVPASPREVDAARQAGSAQGAADAAALRAADEKVKQAEAALAAGKEPQPGERIGTAGGASRLNDSYWERQKKLEQAVTDAKADLEKARSGR